MDKYLKIQSRRIKKGRRYGKATGESNRQGKIDVSKRRKETDKKFFLQDDGSKEGAKLRENFGCFGTPVQKRSGQADGISSASRTSEGSTYKGNTEYIAELIRKETKADLFEIVPRQAYANVYEMVRDRAEQEQEQDARPAIKNEKKNISQYDTIYVGYPIWLAYHNLIQCTQA